MSNMNLNKRILRVSQVLTRLASNSKVRDGLWAHMQFDRKMNADNGYTPTKGVLSQRERSRQFEEIKNVGLSIDPSFKLEYDGSSNLWGTFTKHQNEWKELMPQLNDKLKSLGYKGVVDRNDIPLDTELMREAQNLYEEYIAELGNS